MISFKKLNLKKKKKKKQKKKKKKKKDLPMYLKNNFIVYIQMFTKDNI